MDGVQFYIPGYIRYNFPNCVMVKKKWIGY